MVSGDHSKSTDASGNFANAHVAGSAAAVPLLNDRLCTCEPGSRRFFLSLRHPLSDVGARERKIRAIAL
jgi:hypothetical protein